MSFPEIAKLVGRTEDAVRMLAKRAIQRLAREMSIGDNASKR
jgi:DNA-directed RNA polymerase specialized sigma24 family protein